MPPLTMWLWFVASFWIVIAVKWSLDIRSIGILPPLEAVSAAPSPSVSVVVAARDEKPRVEAAVLRLLGQRFVSLQLIVVDDRSTDGTRELLGDLERRFDGLTVIRVDELPAGWLGKCHALHVGAGSATGDWILFADADVWVSEDLIVRAVREAERQRAGHVCLLPSQKRATIPGRAANLVFSAVLTGSAAGANRDSRFAYIGIGAFNMVRRDAYVACGGHELLRLEVCDDIKLGLLLKRAGVRTRALFAGHDLEVDWATSAGGMVRAIEKNSFAMLRFSPALAGLVVGTWGVLWGSAVAGPFTGSAPGYAAGLGLGLLVLPARMLSAAAGWGWIAPLMVPFVFPLLPWAILRSAWVTLRRGGVRWRGTFYPLEVLRGGLVK